MFSSNSDTQLIIELDLSLREVLQNPNQENLRQTFHLIRQCEERRQNKENSTNDDQLYVPALLILRNFSRFQHATVFDELLQQFRLTFPIISISSKKILDDFLCTISVILTKRIVPSNDEVQQHLFIKFVQEFFDNVKKRPTLFYEEFLGDFNNNLPMIGHFLSCFLQFFQQVNSLDYRLDVLKTFWSLFYVENTSKRVDYQQIVGQILSCFLPGLLKTLVENLGSSHQRLIQMDFLLLSYIFRLTIRRSNIFYDQPIKEELKDLIVERNDQWLTIVDAHLYPLFQRLTNDYVQHENISVRRSLAILMLNILCFSSSSVKNSTKIAMKTILLVLSKNDDPMLRAAVDKLFQRESNFFFFQSNEQTRCIRHEVFFFRKK